MLERDKLQQILASENYLTAKDLEAGLKLADDYKMSLDEALLSEGLITREILGQAVAEYYGVPYVDLQREKVDEDLARLIPEIIARRYQMVPIDKQDKYIRLAMANPKDLAAMHLAEKKLSERIKPCYVSEQDLDDAFLLYGGDLGEEFKKILADTEDSSQEDKDEAIIRIVDLLLDKAADSQASDIHIEPYIKTIVIRYRIDGVMHRVLSMDKALAEPVITRIKVMSKLRTDEHRSAQDGKLRFMHNGQAVDVRVSVVPITEGENIVLRLLVAKTNTLTLPTLGLIDKDFKKIKKAIAKPHGMILVTGPTGSGKTTTLYAVLNILNQEEVHISTIEDPVEYAIEGISQIQVDNKTNLTFASGLRSILRQDPDIIMIGEIRDAETAGIAVNAALTGHLVLSTLHTNDAPTSLPRLLDMGVEPFLVASTVNVIVAQRLVRKNCEQCRVSSALSEEELFVIENEDSIKDYLKKHGYKDLKKINVYKGKGCHACDHTGYQGRVGIFEILEIDNHLRRLITDKADSATIMDYARSKGMNTMLEDGLEKVLSGLTSIEEVLRVTRD